MDAGHNVEIVTSAAYLPEKYQKEGKWIYVTSHLGIKMTVVNNDYSNEMTFVQRIFSFITFAILASYISMRRSPDIVFATSTPLTIVIPGIVGKIWNRIPLVVEIRDLWPELPIAIGAIRNPILIWATRLLEKTAYSMSSHVIALSPGMRDGIASTGYPPERISVLPNSCDVDAFNVSSDEGLKFRNQFEWLYKHPLVIYAGTIGPINGVGYLPQLAQKVYDIDTQVRFLVVGRGGYEEQIVHDLAKKLGVLNKNFYMIPQIPKSYMPAALSAATISTSLFIDLPEMQNNSANKFFDALASGTPVAINYGGWQAEILEKSGAGITLHPSDFEHAAETLVAFLRDERGLRQSAAHALSLAKTQFSRDDMARTLEQILLAVIEEHSSAEHTPILQ